MAAKTQPQDKDTPKAKDDQPLIDKSGQVPEAPVAPSPSDGQADSDGAAEKTSAENNDPEPEPEKQQYLVTGRTDVLHNADLYTEGDSLWLNEDDAYSLLKAGCIQPVGR